MKIVVKETSNGMSKLEAFSITHAQDVIKCKEELKNKSFDGEKNPSMTINVVAWCKSLVTESEGKFGDYESISFKDDEGRIYLCGGEGFISVFNDIIDVLVDSEITNNFKIKVVLKDNKAGQQYIIPELII